jgi:hypothetical protein
MVAQGHAAVITWSGSALAGLGTTTISTLGQLVEAHNVGSSPPALNVGGVLFDNNAADNNPLGTTIAGVVNLPLTGNATYDSLLDSASYAVSPVTYVIDGLVSGTRYLVQFFVADTRTDGLANTRTVTYSDGGGSTLTSTPLGGGFAFTGIFIATGATQSVVISGNGPNNGNVAYINAWQLRNASVPEPASLTLWGLGALGLSIAGYRRRKAAEAARSAV